MNARPWFDLDDEDLDENIVVLWEVMTDLERAGDKELASAVQEILRKLQDERDSRLH